MVIERCVKIGSTEYTVVLSDETDSLLAAAAAGKAVIGLWNPDRPEVSLFPARYVVERPEDADTAYLERAVRRHLGLPLIIGQSERLMIREFTMEDCRFVPLEEEAGEDDALFRSPELLHAYIKNQYEFFEYGIWAVVRAEDGVLLGKAGISPLPASGPLQLQESGSDYPAAELSYHIFRPFRRQGFALEACRLILSYARAHVTPDIFIRIMPDNRPSARLAGRLGFSPARGALSSNEESPDGAPVYYCCQAGSEP